MKHVILIPTYNESQNIEMIISKIFDLNKNIFIKVIDDNSPDGTGQIVLNLMQKYPNLSILSRSGKEGLGKAYIGGFKEVLKDPEATRVIMMDADLSHKPEYLAEMLDKSKTFDLVVGSRYIKGGDTVGWEVWRKMLSLFGNIYTKMVIFAPINDMTAGFNCINLNILRKVDLDGISSSGYAFQIELKALLLANGASYKEIPIVFVNRIGGESKISNHIVKEGILAPWKILWKKMNLRKK